MLHVQSPGLPESSDQTLANLLCMLHIYFIGEHCDNCEERLKHAICVHLEQIGRMPEFGPVTREAGRDLAQHWMMKLRSATSTAH